MNQCLDAISGFIISEFFKIFFLGSGISIAFKTWAIFYATRIIGFIELFLFQKKLLKHPIFEKIQLLIEEDAIAISVMDEAKQMLLQDIFCIELLKIKQLLMINLHFIVFKYGIFRYIFNYKKISSTNIISSFSQGYLKYRDNLEIKLKYKFVNKGLMNKDDFKRFWWLYKEISLDFKINIHSNLNILRGNENSYQVLSLILSNFSVLIEIMYKTLPNKFNRMNGRANGIVYKNKEVNKNNDKDNRYIEDYYL